MYLPAAFPTQVLVVEDHPDVLILLQCLLEDEGYSFTKASSLPAALTMLEKQLFHLVLTDLFASDWDNPLESISPLLMKAAPIPVGVLTAWPVAADEAAKAGLAFLLQKPFDVVDFQRAIASVVYGLNSRSHQTEVAKEFFAALNARDWKRLERLCIPDLAVFPLSSTRGTPSRLYTRLSGVEPFFLEHLFFDLPGFAIEKVRVYNHPMGAAARYLARWQDSDGRIHRSAQALYFLFQGERIAQIGGAL